MTDQSKTENQETKTNTETTSETSVENTETTSTETDSTKKGTEEVDIKVDIPVAPADKETFSKAEVNELLSKATRKGAQTAKEQLYPEIKRMKAKMDELTKNQNKSTTTDAEKLAMEKEKELLQKKVEVLETATLDLKNQTEELRGSLNKEKLSAKKNSLIASAKGRVIESMVVGNTEEEIQASFESAKAEYEKIEGSIGERLKIKIPAVESTEKSNEQEETKITPVNRLQSKDDFRNYGKERAKNIKDVYREYGLDV